jgi:hypothetical protein
MKKTTIGIDLAKTVFQIHGVDDHGKPVLRKRLDRSKMLILCQATALFGRNGSVWQRALLGTQADCHGTYRQADGTAIRQAVREDEQK